MESIIPWVVMLPAIMAWILFLFINIKTVRRLRKNPITRDELGFHLVWGWYAITISLTLFVSKERMAKRRSYSDGFLFANQDLMAQYTTPFEKVICKLMASLVLFVLVCMFLLIAWNGVEYLMNLVE
ncbi:hypothetical protein MNBD_GAMMA17-1010 [hydrothermal vent metagenome]|uniref:Uncharacterized protein n=1 Tax=hydrothermal vent metagenome TaxID=652676 RepID=A0A3B0YYU9_9ZZZZ